MRNLVLSIVLLLAAVAIAGAQVTCPSGANHCAQVNWSASTSGAPTSYAVYRTTTSGGCSSVSGASCTKAGTVTAPATSFVDSPLAAITTYFWVVTASNAAGESVPSSQVTGTTGPDPVPAAPTNVTVTAK